jgi:hypothetical protein
MPYKTHFAAETEAIYANRPFSRLPREALHNWITNLIRLLSQ